MKHQDRFPRTLEQAFGPYTSQLITEAEEPMHPHDRIVVIASVIAAVALVVLIVWGGV
jgi:hypothetical protein